VLQYSVAVIQWGMCVTCYSMGVDGCISDVCFSVAVIQWGMCVACASVLLLFNGCGV
jgi:hypothetical protein